ncbi:kinase-like protein [Xylaria venustula]|nr:kinase-like protein [Xylaria venustula]
MGPRAVSSSARDASSPSSVTFPGLCSSQNSPRKATRCIYRFASKSLVFTPTSTYVIDEVPSERTAAGRIWCVYRTTHKGKQFILKNIIPGDFDYIVSLQKHVEHFPHKKLLYVDTVAFFSVAKKAIIKDAFTGFADLHDKHIIYTDIKPTNSRVLTLKWCNVHITDLEAAVILLPTAKGLTDRLQGEPCFPRGAGGAILHLSFFASNEENFEGFLACYGKENNPFFKDLICKMTRIDFSRRITAQKALRHLWFAAE